VKLYIRPMSEAHAEGQRADAYRLRMIDGELDELFTDLPAISIEGARAVGKTVTAERRAATVYRLDDSDERRIVEAEPSILATGERPVLIDEWQRLPESFDRVRRAVDDGAEGGSFLLTGSARPTNLPEHSGAGRIVRVRLRPMTLAERGCSPTTVSLAELIEGGQPKVEGVAEMGLSDYVEEILASGFPGIRRFPHDLRRAQLDSYVDHIVDHDFEELDYKVRKPAILRRWMAAYAAATATTASFEKIRDAAASESGETPTRRTVLPYRDVLEQLWILDPVEPWLPTRNRLKRLAAPFKHHLADPALAARLLGAEADTLLKARPAGPAISRDGTLLGALFESLATLCVRVYAQRGRARIGHLRTWSGEREIDLIVERGQSIVAIEVKLGGSADDRDVRHLLWLREKLGDELADAVVLTTGRQAYRRQDGIAVVPLALLGP
jgi:predicted AAA+ superfamily ATPase